MFLDHKRVARGRKKAGALSRASALLLETLEERLLPSSSNPSLDPAAVVPLTPAGDGKSLPGDQPANLQGQPAKSAGTVVPVSADPGADAVNAAVSGASGDAQYASLLLRSLSPATALHASITGLPSSGHSNEGAAVTVNAQATGGASGADGYSWRVTQGSQTLATGTGAALTFTPAEHGSYRISLTVTDGAHATATANQTLVVDDVAPVTWVSGPSTGLQGAQLGFTVTAFSPSAADTAAGFLYHVDYGDGTGGSSPGRLTGSYSASHMYAAPGTYTVTVTATDRDNGVGVNTMSVRVTAPANPLHASITGLPTSGHSSEGAPLSLGVQVTGGAAGQDRYSWTATQGTQVLATAGTATVSSSPLAAGTYQITVTVTDANGATATDTRTLVIDDVPPAAWVSGPTAGVQNTPLSFTASASSPNPVDNTAGFQYRWTFGDGSPSTTGGASVTHTYTTPGTYTVTVAVTDHDGSTSTATASVTVTAQSTGSLQASITGLPSSGHSNEGAAVTVNAQATGGAAGAAGYSWRVTQGSQTLATGTGASLTFTPTEHGSYLVSLTVTDSAHATATASQTLVVDDVPPVVSLQAPYSGQQRTVLSFTAGASSPSAADGAAGFTYSWDFGDGGTGSGPTVTHTFANYGGYTVRVTVTDHDGAHGSASAFVNVVATDTGDPGDPLNKPVLNQSDITYLGSFKLPTYANGWSTAFSTGGLAYRYVNGNLQFFTTSHVYSGGLVYEFNYPGIGTGDYLPQAQVVTNWGDVYTGQKWLNNADAGPGDGTGGAPLSAGNNTYGLYYDQSGNRLYWNYGHWYNATDPENPSFGYSILNDATGVATGAGAWSLAGRPEKFDRGGITPIPQWFANRFTGGMNLGVGFGGYFSIVQDASFGPALAATSAPNPAVNPNRSALPNVPLIGYPANAPGRAERDPNYSSSYDGGAWNPTNGVGYWTWSDIIYGSGSWIDTPSLGGVLIIAKLGEGDVWYSGSERHSSGAAYEWMVYDPKDLAAVASGAKQQWEIQPKYEWTDDSLPVNPVDGYHGYEGDGLGQVGGVTFDPTTNRLYVLTNAAWNGGSEWYPEINVYQVGTPTGGAAAVVATAATLGSPATSTATTATWDSAQLSPTLYTLQATWNAAATNSSAAVYQIYDGATLLQTVSLNQQLAPVGEVYGGSVYQNLTNFPLSGNNLRVVLTGQSAAQFGDEGLRVAPAPAVTLAGPATGSAGAALAFSASASDADLGDAPASWDYAWDFGDGSTGTGQAVNHTYATPGHYTVRLTVTDGDLGSTLANAAVTIL